MGTSASIESHKFISFARPETTTSHSSRRHSWNHLSKTNPKRRLSLSSLKQVTNLIPSNSKHNSSGGSVSSYFLSEAYFQQLSDLLSKHDIYEKASRGESPVDPFDENYMREALKIERGALVEQLSQKGHKSFGQYSSSELIELCDAFFNKRYQRIVHNKLELANLLKIRMTNIEAYSNVNAWCDIDVVRFDNLELDTAEWIQKQIITKGLTSLGHWDDDRLEEKSVPPPDAYQSTKSSSRRRSSLISTASDFASTLKSTFTSTHINITDDTASVMSDISSLTNSSISTTRSTPSKLSTLSKQSHPSVLLKQKKRARISASSKKRTKKINLNKMLTTKAPHRPQTTSAARRGMKISSPAKGKYPIGKRAVSKPKVIHKGSKSEASRPETTPVTSKTRRAPTDSYSSSEESTVLKPKRRLSRKENAHITHYNANPPRRSSLTVVAKKVDGATHGARKRLSDAVKFDPLLMQMRRFQSTGNNFVSRTLSASFKRSSQKRSSTELSDTLPPLTLQLENLRSETLSIVFQEIGYYKPVLLFSVPFFSPYFRSCATKLNRLYESFSPQLGFAFVFTFGKEDHMLAAAQKEDVTHLEQRCQAVHSLMFQQLLEADLVFVDGVDNRFCHCDLVEFPFALYLVQNSNVMHVESSMIEGALGESVDFSSVETYLRAQGYGRDQ
uniref:Uncharacterized protein n=1 Tax=Percolomonas cosmopolitus TaxID=63605 RepID=A0A7S1KPF1_9EUKA